MDSSSNGIEGAFSCSSYAVDGFSRTYLLAAAKTHIEPFSWLVCALAGGAAAVRMNWNGSAMMLKYNEHHGFLYSSTKVAIILLHVHAGCA